MPQRAGSETKNGNGQVSRDTAPNDPGDCERGAQGSWGLSDAGRATWAAAVDECAALCGACARCVHVTVSPAEGDCSWYRRCPGAQMLRAANFRSGRVRARPVRR